ncbi:MAG: hypothetical protein ACRCZN_01910 [Lactococcus lactis]
MTIKPYTFASISGASFPVGANNDGRLYQILANKMKNGEIKRYDFANPVNTALNRQYTGTAVLAGGRYFELINEQVVLTANATNYITANINLTNTATPVTISVESSDKSNTVDINSGSGILRVCFETVTTDGSSVLSTTNRIETEIFQNVVANDVTTSTLNASGLIRGKGGATINGNVTVSGNIASTGIISGGPKTVLANGAYWMQAGQVITPTKAITDCANGWILHFTSYSSGMNGSTKNGNNHFFYIPKEQVNIADVGTMFPLVVSDGTMTLKYLYLQNNKITGNAANESTNSKKYVLQNVLEY